LQGATLQDVNIAAVFTGDGQQSGRQPHPGSFDVTRIVAEVAFDALPGLIKRLRVSGPHEAPSISCRAFISTPYSSSTAYLEA
jgi:hypothetical protein